MALRGIAWNISWCGRPNHRSADNVMRQVFGVSRVTEADKPAATQRGNSGRSVSPWQSSTALDGLSVGSMMATETMMTDAQMHGSVMGRDKPCSYCL